MVDTQDAHVGAPPRAALLHDLGGGVIETHEGHRARRDPHGGAHRVSLGAQAGEGEPRAPSGLVDQRHALERVVDPALTVGEGIVDGKHEARRELSERPSRVHQRGGVGLERARRHEVVELARDFVDRRIGCAMAAVLLGDHARDPPEHGLGLFDGLALLVLLEIAEPEDDAGVLRERRAREIGGRHVVRRQSVRRCGS